MSGPTGATQGCACGTDDPTWDHFVARCYRRDSKPVTTGVREADPEWDVPVTQGGAT